MKKITPYQKALKIAKKLRKQSFLDDYMKLIDKVCASIAISMNKLGFDILDESGTGEKGKLDFLSFENSIEKNIIGINKNGEIGFLNEGSPVPIRRCIIDGNISLEDAIALDDELKSSI